MFHFSNLILEKGKKCLYLWWKSWLDAALWWLALILVRSLLTTTISIWKNTFLLCPWVMKECCQCHLHDLSRVLPSHGEHRLDKIPSQLPVRCGIWSKLSAGMDKPCWTCPVNLFKALLTHLLSPLLQSRFLLRGLWTKSCPCLRDFAWPVDTLCSGSQSYCLFKVVLSNMCS